MTWTPTSEGTKIEERFAKEIEIELYPDPMFYATDLEYDPNSAKVTYFGECNGKTAALDRYLPDTLEKFLPTWEDLTAEGVHDACDGYWIDSRICYLGLF